MNFLEEYFKNNESRVMHKWMHYFEIYDRYFSRYRGTDVHILEIGIEHGGSLQMWKAYFGSKCKVFGVDINKKCEQVEEDQIKVIIGDQGDKTFLKQLVDDLPRIDILIYDGSHIMSHQIETFEELFPHIYKNGIYLCEDNHCSYHGRWGGGYKESGSFIEFSKNLIDKLHARHSKTDELKIDRFTTSAYAMHYYDGALVIEKRPATNLISGPSGDIRLI